MSKEEYLRGLEEALSGEVPASVIRDNLNYYSSYIAQEMAKGRTVDEIADEIGEPYIVARTIIDSCEAAGETGDGDGYGSYQEAYTDSGSRESYGREEQNRSPHIHYIDLSKWYWKLLLILVVIFVCTAVFQVVGGIFYLLMRFAGPLCIIFLLIWLVRNMRR
ncbi:MAG: hypothetical protein MR528_05300 [Lachnospiraceae bacterium]|nr:hypothetical protein [Lachnospiraceae bacterium]